LAQARLYVCTDARAALGDLAEFIDAITATGTHGPGVDIVQLRDKSLDARETIAALTVVRERCEANGALWCVNDCADIAASIGAPVVHVGQDDLSPAAVRAIVGPDVLIGQSTHSAADLAGAIEDRDVDYFAVGPLWATPTKPGRPAAGLGYLEQAVAADAKKPWFAIGGIDETNISEVISMGASRVVVVRAVTEARDPAAAVRALRSRLMPIAG
jgi:thiamine-phosphate pyrophosphorylase